MHTYIRSALNQIKAEDDLVEKTEKYLRSTIFNKKNEKLINFKMRSVFSMKKFAIAACAVVLVCGMSIGGYAYYKTPVAYLSLDINPSVELGVNALNNVVSATGYNADGKTILDEQNVINLSVKDAVNKLVKSASDKGFIASDGSTIVSVTSETKNASTAAILEKDAEQGVSDAIKSKGDIAVVYKDNVALSRRDDARKLGITPGKLNLIQKLQVLDPTITIDQYKDAKVTEIMKKVVELKKSAKVADSASSDINSDSSASSSIKPDDNDDTDIQDIEKAVEQSDKNKNEKAGDNNNSQINENNSETDNQKNDNKNNSETTSSVTASSVKASGNNYNQKDKNNSQANNQVNDNNNDTVTSSSTASSR
jgi:hypothetical protein